MNLHILPDSKFSQAFYQNIKTIGLSGNNKFVIRSNAKKLQYIEDDLPFAKASSTTFRNLTGDTLHYKKVFIHNFSPVLYRWVAANSFHNLNWMVWGSDLYNLPFIHHEFYEELTKSILPGSYASLRSLLYDIKIRFSALPHKEKAFSKISTVHTWMKSEYEFARRNLPSLLATHNFFFYENQLPYENFKSATATNKKNEKVKTFLVGNSGYAINNHLDAIEFALGLEKELRLKIPVSYGDSRYISKLRKFCSERKYRNIEFIDRHVPGKEYFGFLEGIDGLIMNTIRPQGYGNIFIMMALGKPVFFNKKNISLPDLINMGLKPFLLNQMENNILGDETRRAETIIKSHFSHERLVSLYSALFA